MLAGGMRSFIRWVARNPAFTQSARLRRTCGSCDESSGVRTVLQELQTWLRGNEGVTAHEAIASALPASLLTLLAASTTQLHVAVDALQQEGEGLRNRTYDRFAIVCATCRAVVADRAEIVPMIRSSSRARKTTFSFTVYEIDGESSQKIG